MPALCAECGKEMTGTRGLAAQDLAGMVINGRYELREYLGQGAAAVVYRAINQVLGVSVAIKLLLGQDKVDEHKAARLRAEARAVSRLSHPNIVAIIDHAHSAGGVHYIVLEYLRGVTLGKLIREAGSLAVGRAVSITLQVLSALEEAHEKGILHRDLKPDNIMVTSHRDQEDFIKLLDFGISRDLEEATSSLTQDGAICGTPSYMAPEQIRSDELTPAADLYSCGILLYHMLSGVNPFYSPSMPATLHRQCHMEAPPLSEHTPHLRARDQLESLLERALLKDPARRFGSARAMGLALLQVQQRLSGEPAFRCACGHVAQQDPGRCPDCGAASAVTAAETADEQPPRAPQAVADLVDMGQGGDTARAAMMEFGAEEASTAVRLRTEPPMRVRFVGREGSLEQFGNFLGGDKGVLEVIGPAGIGKTRLMGQLGRGASRAGYRVLRAGPDPSQAAPALYPVLCLAAQLLGLPRVYTTGKQLRAACRQAGLGREHLRGMMGLFDIEQVQDERPPAERLRLISEAMWALMNAGEARSCFLLLDDVASYDRPSLGVFKTLFRRATRGSAHRVALAARKPVARGKTVARLELGPLDARSVGAIVSEALGPYQVMPHRIIGPVADMTAGNPLHLLQAIRLMAEGAIGLDLKLYDMVAARLGRLPQRALALLQGICAAGLACPARWASELSGVTGDVRDSLQLLVRRGYVQHGSTSVLLVTHGVISRTVSAVTPAHLRRQLHGRIFSLLDPARDDVITRAHHALAADLKLQAAPLLEQAANRFDALDDPRRAVHLRERAEAL